MTDPNRPTGTVYGREEPGGLPRAVPIIVGVCLVAVVALGFVAWNSTGGRPDEPATPAAAATVASPEAGTASAAPVKAELSAGQWLLSPLGDENTYLTVNGEFAKMSPADPATLTVVAGLADGSCWSFHLADGRYLRHSDYRLRLDASDDSELFRNDATFCQEAGTDVGTIRLRSKNYPEYLLHRRDDDSLYIDKPEGTSFEVQTSFMVQPVS